MKKAELLLAQKTILARQVKMESQVIASTYHRIYHFEPQRLCFPSK